MHPSRASRAPWNLFQPGQKIPGRLTLFTFHGVAPFTLRTLWMAKIHVILIMYLFSFPFLVPGILNVFVCFCFCFFFFFFWLVFSSSSSSSSSSATDRTCWDLIEKRRIVYIIASVIKIMTFNRPSQEPWGVSCEAHHLLAILAHVQNSINIIHLCDFNQHLINPNPTQWKPTQSFQRRIPYPCYTPCPFGGSKPWCPCAHPQNLENRLQ